MHLIVLSSLSSRASLGNQAGGCQPFPQPEVSLVECTCPIGWGTCRKPPGRPQLKRTARRWTAKRVAQKPWGRRTCRVACLQTAW
eukprot:scaffold282_cov345-Pavlova_lutheri.AAC.4